MRATTRSRGRWAALAALVGVFAVGGVAYASIPDPGGVIHGCFKKSGGALRVIDSAVTNCAANEISLNWDQTAEQGPPGVSGYEIVTEARTEDAQGFFGGRSPRALTARRSWAEVRVR